MKNPKKAWQKAREYAESGRFKKALGVCLKLQRDLPDNPSINFLLGYCERNLTNYPKALRYLHAAQSGDPDNPQIYFQIGCAWDDMGNFEEAEKWYLTALKIAPQWGEALTSLADTVASLGRKEEAVSYYRKALEVSPNLDGAAFNLASQLFDDENLAPCADTLEHALRINPELFHACPYLAFIYWLQDDHEKSESYLTRASKAGLDHLLDSVEYIQTHQTDETRVFGFSFDTLGHAMAAVTISGLMLEFGVNFGTSIRFIASLTDDHVHGFDSFEGIPDDWGKKRKGSYSTYGTLPDVPENVTLHKGWFSETLPEFLDQHGDGLAFANIDCDLYGSTKDIFDEIGPRLRSGTILVFDEYLINPNWREHEYKAFQEFIATTDFEYEYIAFGLFSKQAVLRIL